MVDLQDNLSIILLASVTFSPVWIATGNKCPLPTMQKLMIRSRLANNKVRIHIMAWYLINMMNHRSDWKMFP
jgi:hypothetical protein